MTLLSKKVMKKLIEIAKDQGLDTYNVSRSKDSTYVYFYDGLKFMVCCDDPNVAICLHTGKLVGFRNSKDKFLVIRASNHLTTDAKNHIEIVTNGKKAAVFYKRGIV